jgi:hypothetical protein
MDSSIKLMLSVLDGEFTHLDHNGVRLRKEGEGEGLALNRTLTFTLTRSVNEDEI